MSSRFSFNASALGLGVLLRRGNDVTVVPSVASVSLAPTGGEGAVSAENHNAYGISFSRAATHVVGYELRPTGSRPSPDTVFRTSAEVFISNLNVFNRLTVTLMKATITSVRDLSPDGESRFEVSASYHGVRIDGREIVPEIDRDLCASPTFSDFTKRIRDKAGVHAQRLRTDEKKLNHFIDQNRGDEPVRSFAVADIQRDDRESIQGAGGTIFVPGLGTVHFGELIVTASRRRLNLLRIDFDRRPNAGDEPDPSGRRRAVRSDNAPPETKDAAADSYATEDAVAAPRMLMNSSADDSGDGSMTAGSAEGNGTPIWPSP